MSAYQLPINDSFETDSLIKELMVPLFNLNTNTNLVIENIKNQIPLFDI
tara:strand:+ start:407 stop:553 length:147 start_codon:yes stop_codon:yes gene_type:complete